MNKIFILSFILIHSLITAQSQTSILEFDGLYEAECDYSNEENSNEGEQSYLRFYPNGKVISVTTDCKGKAQDLKSWFNTDMDDLSIGEYKITNHKIKFSSISAAGKVKYKGKISKSGLITLRWCSLINGNKGEATYKYIPLEFEK